MLYLASRSPRRMELLKQLGVEFEIVTIEVDEQPQPAEHPEKYVTRMAASKSAAALQKLGKESSIPVLAADTTVVFGDRIIGKPGSQQEAEQILISLANHRHRVLTAISITRGQTTRTKLSQTVVQFGDISERQAELYWQTGEPADKAGGYAIQGIGAIFVERIEGSYSAVVGLPLRETAELLSQFDIHCLSLRAEQSLK